MVTEANFIDTHELIYKIAQVEVGRFVENMTTGQKGAHSIPLTPQEAATVAKASKYLYRRFSFENYSISDRFDYLVCYFSQIQMQHVMIL